MSDLISNEIDAIYRLLLRQSGDVHLAADLTQETALRAWRNRRSLRRHDKPRVWMMKIAMNLWRDHLRRKLRTQGQSGEVSELADRQPLPEQVLDQREELHALLKAIDQLPARQRQTIGLKLIEQLDVKEIAEVLSITAENVRVNLSLARKALRELLKERNEERERPNEPAILASNRELRE